MQNQKIVIGIDAALAETGWGVLRANERGEIQVDDWGWVKTAAESPLFERVSGLRNELWKMIRSHLCSGTAGDLNGTFVVIEKTDYSPGRGDSRERWIREARAREALAIGVTTAMLACADVGITPTLLGPNEWHEELGVEHRNDEPVKKQVAWLVAQQFPKAFELKYRGNTAAFRVVAVDGEKIVAVPTHVTDALGMAYVQMNRLFRAELLVANVAQMI